MCFELDKKKCARILEIILYLTVILTFAYFIIKGTKIESNAYYYTLSTISQTLASMIAFTGMFLLYRLQIVENERVSLSEQLEEVSSNAINYPPFKCTLPSPNYDILYKLYNLNHEERYKEVVEYFKGLSGINENLFPQEVRNLIAEYKKIKEKLDNNLKSHSDAKKLMKNPLIYSFSAIGLSIIFLSMGEFIFPHLIGIGCMEIFGVIVLISLSSCFRILEVFMDLLWSK